MGEGHQVEKMGFSGLDSLVSEIDMVKPLEPAGPFHENKTAVLKSGQTVRHRVYVGKLDPTLPFSTKNWILVILVLVLIIWIDASNKSTVTLHPSRSAQEPPYKAAFSGKEEIPPVGRYLLFNQEQIRYCLSEKIRLLAWKEKVNNYSQGSVAAFNIAIHDFNGRCSNFRYHPGSMESTREQVESNRANLQLQGIAKAMENP